MNSMFYPRKWSDYTQTSKALGLAVSEPLSAWASRFRAAKAFKEMLFDELSDASQRAYFVAQKLTLADIAIEAFERAVDIEVGTLQIVEPNLAIELWDLRQAQLKSLLSTIENRKLRLAYEAFRDLKKDQVHEADLRFVVRAFRHANSHGLFNPAKAELYRAKTYSRTLLALADSALAACEESFVRLLEDGTLACDLNVENRAQHFRNLNQVSSVYVGAIQSIDVADHGLLIKRLHSPAWQLIDFETLTLGEISFDKDAVPRPSVSVLEENEAAPHRKNLEEVSNSSHVIWRLPDGNWIAANGTCFLLYSPSTEQVLKRFAIPQGVLPSFLNDRKLNLTRDFSGAIVPMWNKTLYLDFQTGITKTINTELWGGAVYAAELDAFVFEDGSSLNLQFKSLKPLEINTDFVGGSAILSLVRADCIVDYPDATSCVVLGNFPSGLKKVNLVTGDTSEIVKAHSAVALTDGQLLIIEGSDLSLINAVGVQIETVSEVSGELCHHSPSTRKVTLVDGITNEWTLIDTETLSREKVVENNFESVLQAQALEQDAYLLVGISNGEIVVSRLQNSVTIFSTVLTGLSRQKVSIVLNAEKTKALVWAKFEKLLYCVDIQNGQRLGRFEFESGILDLVWPEGSPLITLFDAFEVSQLNLESGHRNKIFDLPNPGISMRLSYDHKSLLVLTTLQSNSFYSTYKSGWLVQCALT